VEISEIRRLKNQSSQDACLAGVQSIPAWKADHLNVRTAFVDRL
jgi:hypothetical protein